MDLNRNLEQDLIESELICSKCADARYAQNLYAAMCNMQWQPQEFWPLLKNELWSCSWRTAGGIVANIRNNLKLTDDNGNLIFENYINWYCSGMDTDYSDDGVRDPVQNADFVAEGVVTAEVKADLALLGWHPVPYQD